jgi:hypothetical protein
VSTFFLTFNYYFFFFFHIYAYQGFSVFMILNFNFNIYNRYRAYLYIILNILSNPFYFQLLCSFFSFVFKSTINLLYSKEILDQKTTKVHSHHHVVFIFSRSLSTFHLILLISISFIFCCHTNQLNIISFYDHITITIFHHAVS